MHLEINSLTIDKTNFLIFTSEMVAILPNAPAGHLGHGLQLRAVLSSQHTAPGQVNRVLLQIFTNVKTLTLSDAGTDWAQLSLTWNCTLSLIN